MGLILGGLSLLYTIGIQPKWEIHQHHAGKCMNTSLRPSNISGGQLRSTLKFTGSLVSHKNAVGGFVLLFFSVPKSQHGQSVATHH